MKKSEVILISVLAAILGALLIYIAVVFYSWLYKPAFVQQDGEQTAKPVVTNSPTVTDLPTVTTTPSPTPGIEGLDPWHYHTFVTSTGTVNFDGDEVTITDDFSKENYTAKTHTVDNTPLDQGLITEKEYWDKALGTCSDKEMWLAAYNTILGNDVAPSVKDTLIIGHTGRCKYNDPPENTFEALRFWVEGAYGSGPAFQIGQEIQRDRTLPEMVGQHIYFNDASFKVVDAKYVTKDQLDKAFAEDEAKYGVKRIGALDRFFTKGVNPHRHQLIIMYCSTEGGTDPTSWFSAKQLILLDYE